MMSAGCFELKRYAQKFRMQALIRDILQAAMQMRCSIPLTLLALFTINISSVRSIGSLWTWFSSAVGTLMARRARFSETLKALLNYVNQY